MTDTPCVEIHPEVVRLRDENALLREELVHLLTESHDLVHTIKPNLLALYQAKIGVWELQQFRLQCQAARLKRKAELIQASLNKGCWPDLTAIEAQLGEEFQAWERKLQAEAERLKAAEERLKHLLSPADDRELKTLYYRLAKKLHPDLNPNLTDEHKRLWRRVQAAYDAGDLDELRALALLVDRTPLPVSDVSSLQRLTEEQHTLELQIRRLMEEIDRIENHPPLTMRHDLASEGWVRTRSEAIQTAITKIQQRCDCLAIHIQSLLKEGPNEQLFSQN